MKKLLPTLLLFNVVSPFLFATTITFRIETNYVLAEGFGFNAENYNNNDAGYDARVFGTTATLATLQSLSFTQQDSQQFISEIQALFSNSGLDGTTNSDGWSEVGIAAPFLQSQGWSWSGQRSDLTSGLYPVLLFTSSPVDSLSTNDFVGLVYSTSGVVGATGSKTVDFTSPIFFWDTAILGSFGSFDLTPIPEPRVYAAIFGLAALGFVAWRRRVRR